MIRFALLFTALIGFGTLAADGPKKAGPKLEYNRDVRPILAENCFACHGPDSAARKANLRLDQREAAIKAGAIVPGKPDESELIRRIFADDEAERMPPAKIAQDAHAGPEGDARSAGSPAGAEYQPHWSLIAPQRPELPVVKRPETWVRNPIDAFILAELEKRGLTAGAGSGSPHAGPPAQPRSDRPAARSRPTSRRSSTTRRRTPTRSYVDRLLQSPHWGEHRGRYWLDAARYADTHGIHFDNYREIWAYRDWVIKAFNRNMPFDQFTIEQLAGDLLPNRTLDQQIASGFNRCNITTNEGGAIAEEYLVLYTRDRTETTSQVWLGLTAGCAVCHDHKFDPLSQREFYSLAAFFNNTTQKAMDGNIKDTPPIVPVPQAEDRPRWEQLPGLITAAQGSSRMLGATPPAPISTGGSPISPADLPYGMTPTADLRFHAPLDEGEGKAIHVDGQWSSRGARSSARATPGRRPRNRRKAIRSCGPVRASKWRTSATSRRTRRSP